MVFGQDLVFRRIVRKVLRFGGTIPNLSQISLAYSEIEKLWPTLPLFGFLSLWCVLVFSICGIFTNFLPISFFWTLKLLFISLGGCVRIISTFTSTSAHLQCLLL